VLNLSAAMQGEPSSTGPRIEATTTAGGCCIFLLGRWICVPC
jgi:hypothetical protein